MLGGVLRIANLLAVLACCVLAAPSAWYGKRREIREGVDHRKLGRGFRNEHMLGLLAFFDRNTLVNGQGIALHAPTAAERLGVSSQTVLDYVADLEEAGWISRPAGQRVVTLSTRVTVDGKRVQKWRRQIVVVVAYENRVGGIAVADWLAAHRKDWQRLSGNLRSEWPF